MTSPFPPQPPPQDRRDFRKEVTESIIKMLQEGVAPWQKPWDATLAGNFAIPFNPTSEKQYRGGNAIHLMATAMRKGYDDPRWMTYKQAAANEWQVHKGEKGTQIEFWELNQDRKGQDPPVTSAEKTASGENRKDNQARFIHRVYTVFNAKQIDGVPAYQPKQHTPFAVADAGEKILAHSGAQINHDQMDRAFYSRGSDSIHLPPQRAFQNATGYYGTALHELAHWTGHPDRLNRPTLNNSYRFGDQNYAREELRAELASVFLAAERGIPHDPTNHASYVGSWIKALSDDKNEIFRAAHDASRATEFLLSLERDKSLAEAIVLDSEAGIGTLELETARLQSDLESNPEIDADLIKPAISVQETEDTIARLDLRNGTVTVHDNLAGTDCQGAVNPAAKTVGIKQAGPTSPQLSAVEQSLIAATELTMDKLGRSGHLSSAVTEGGVYRGKVLGQTEHHIIQQVNPKSAVAHPKELLDSLPQVGQRIAITYSDAQATVREIRERSKAQELAR